jgi:hypothetical protein
MKDRPFQCQPRHVARKVTSVYSRETRVECLKVGTLEKCNKVRRLLHFFCGGIPKVTARNTIRLAGALWGVLDHVGDGDRVSQRGWRGLASLFQL